MTVLHAAPLSTGTPRRVSTASPARAINPATGRLAATIRLTPWANSLRHDGVAAVLGATHLPPELVDGPRFTCDNLQTLCRPCNSSKGATA